MNKKIIIIWYWFLFLCVHDVELLVNKTDWNWYILLFNRDPTNLFMFQKNKQNKWCVSTMTGNANGGQTTQLFFHSWKGDNLYQVKKGKRPWRKERQLFEFFFLNFINFNYLMSSIIILMMIQRNSCFLEKTFFFSCVISTIYFY